MDQGEKFKQEFTYPAQPFSTRGLSTMVDAHSGAKKLVYCVSNIVVVRDTEDLTRCTVFDQHKTETTAARISPSGNLCASADKLGNVFLWEINTPGHPVTKQYENVLGGAIRDIAWTGDNQRLVFAGEGKTYFAKGILLDTGSSLGDISGVSKPLNACDLRRDRPFRLAVGGEEFHVSFYEGPPFKFKKSSKQHTNFVTCLRYNKSGDHFVSGSSDRKVFLYEGKDCGELKEVQSANPHTRTVTGVTWLDDKTFVTSSNDTTVKVWNVTEQEGLIKTFKTSDTPHELEDMQVGVAEANGDVFSFSLGGSLQHYKDAANLSDGSQPTQRYHGHANIVNALAYDSVNNLLVTGDNNGKILLWSPDNQSHLPKGTAHSKQVFSVALNSDNTKVFSLGGEEVKVLDIATKQFEQTVECKGQVLSLKAANTDPTSFFVLLENGVVLKFTNGAQSQEYKVDFETSAFAVSADDKFVFVGDKQGFVHQLDATSGKEVHKFTLWQNRVTTITASPDAAQPLLLAGDSTGKIRLWNYEAQTEHTDDRWVHHTTIVSSLTFSPNFKYVVSTGQDNKFLVYDVATKAKVGEKLNAHRRGILTGTVTKDGLIVTSGGDNAIKVFRPTEQSFV